MIWKPVKGREGYSVSDTGEVRNDKTGKILKGFSHTKGYRKVEFYPQIDGKKDEQYVHRLVADAFIDNPAGLPQVNHLNGNKLDNRASNLEWCDNGYNSMYGSILRKVVKAIGENATPEELEALRELLKGESA